MSIIEEIKEAIEVSGGDSALELNLSEIQIQKITPQIKKFIENCKELEVLILSACGLTTLDNLPDSNLTAIDLSENNLGDQELAKLAKYKDLGQLIFNSNNITKLDSLKSVVKLQHLEQLDFSDNPISQENDYKEFVWNNFPNLKVLDRYDRQGNQHFDDDGQFDEQNEHEDAGQDDFDDQQDEDQDDEQYDDDDESQEPQPKKKR